jgi:hypothetical protein
MAYLVPRSSLLLYSSRVEKLLKEYSYFPSDVFSSPCFVCLRTNFYFTALLTKNYYSDIIKRYFWNCT